MTPLSLDARDSAAVERVEDLLDGKAPLGVALSGGVDSSVLLALAARMHGRRQVLAVVGVSDSFATSDRLTAHDVARHVGVPAIEVETHEGERPEYRRNGPDRCFHCRDELFTRISEDVVARLGLRAIAYGEISDDRRRPDRPGARAAAAHGVLAPLADAGIDKAAVRRLARALSLPSAERPAAPCLASRIPHFVEVEPAMLRQVEAAEAALHDLGLTEVRVRHHGAIARIEAPWSAWAALDVGVRDEICRRLTAVGFAHVTVDLAGLRSGAFTMTVLAAGDAS
ncbi:asparagine synthase-related protein [Spirillospora sp. CA-255316]